MAAAGEESWTTGQVDATLLSGTLRVGHVPAEQLCQCTHALVKLLVLDAEDGEVGEPAWGDALLPHPPPVTPAVAGARDRTTSFEARSDLHPSGQNDPGHHGRDAARASHSDQDQPEPAGVNIMLVQDVDGLTVIVNELFYRHLQASGVVHLMRWAPYPWRALQIHLGPASVDAPGIISYLSDMLSERNVSILNFSTFETDLILLQDFDLDKARKLLVECGRDGVFGLKEQIAEKRHLSEHKADSNSPAAAGGASAAQGAVKAAPSTKARSNSTASETRSVACLAVLQNYLLLASIKRSVLRQTMFSLMKQLTRHIDIQLQLQVVRGKIAATASSSNEAAEAVRARLASNDYLWAYFSTKEEVSLLLDERDLMDFPEDALVVCPQRWKAIRLLGKDIPFDETGIVHIMSSPYEVGVQLLNMSTYSTNVSLVAEDEVEMAINRLRLELNGAETKVYGSYSTTAN